MATSVVFNGSTFSVPAYGDSGWAQGAGNLSSYLIAISNGTLQTTGGAFTLSAPVNFGATYGIIAAYLTSTTASPATVGTVRLALSDEISWGPGNLALTVVGTALYFNGSPIGGGGGTENVAVIIATGGQTLVNGFGTYINNGVNLQVFVNGLHQDVTYDYLETSTTSITFNSGLYSGDRVSLRWVS